MPLTALFISTVFVMLCIGGLLRPIFAVLGYLMIYILYNPDIWWGAMIAEYLPRPSFVAFLFVITGSLLHADKLNWSISRREIQLYLFLGAVWLSSLGFGVGMDENSWFYLEKITKVFIFVFFFLRVVNTVERYRLVIGTFIFGGIFLAYQAHILGPSHFSTGRLDTLGGIDFRDANGFAAFLAGTMVFLGVYLLRAAWWKKMLSVMGIALMMNAVVFTQSRAAVLGFALAAPYALLRAPRKERKFISLCITLGALLLFFLADPHFIERMSTLETVVKSGNEYVTNEYAEEAPLSRIDFWRASVPMFKDHPMGVGIKNFEKLVPYYDPRNIGMDAHNTFVLCYSEIGIVGIFLLGLIIIGGWLQLWRIRRAAPDNPGGREIKLHVFALELVLIIYLFGYLTTHSMLYNEIVWVLLAMPLCLGRAALTMAEETECPPEAHTAIPGCWAWSRKRMPA